MKLKAAKVRLDTGERRDHIKLVVTDLRRGVAVEYVSCEPTLAARKLFGEEAAPEE